MTLKLLEEILHFKKECKNMIESDKEITKSYLVNKVKRKKLSKRLIEIIEKINQT